LRGWGGEGGGGVGGKGGGGGRGGEMSQALYAHMNNNKKRKIHFYAFNFKGHIICIYFLQLYEEEVLFNKFISFSVSPCQKKSQILKYNI
jgi:hypothetical protein